MDNVRPLLEIVVVSVIVRVYIYIYMRESYLAGPFSSCISCI